METNNNEKQPKQTTYKYSCKLCDYNTSKKCNYSDHLLTSKHLAKQKCSEKQPLSSLQNYGCNICGKKYSNRSGLWRHKKKCNEVKENDEMKELMNHLIKDNIELKSLVIKLINKSDY